MTTNLPKLGIILQYYNLRPDIPALIDALAEDWQIVLFARARDLDSVETAYEKRAIPEEPRSVRNDLAKVAYELLGNLPSDTETYKLWRLRQITRQARISRWKERALLETRLRLANCLSFDRYLANLTVDRRTEISDIDVFFATSDVYDVNFLAHILSHEIPILTYIYSWDHSAKYYKFSRRISKYLTWNGGITDDIHELHGIPREKIVEVGSTQLSLVEQYMANAFDHPRAVPYQRYVYYAATWGYPDAMVQELNLVKELASLLREIDPNAVLLVRPYPNAKAFGPYETLLNQTNIRLDNAAVTAAGLRFTTDSSDEKYTKVRDAQLFVHMGSTIGLEAAYFDTPILHLALSDFDYGYPPHHPCHLAHTFNQRHLTKYMESSKEPNVISNVADLRRVVADALASPGKFLAYNRELRDLNPLLPLADIAKHISQELASSLPNAASVSRAAH